MAGLMQCNNCPWKGWEGELVELPADSHNPTLIRVCPLCGRGGVSESEPFEFRGYPLPLHMEKSLHDYIYFGRPVGGFLQAVIENNLQLAVGKADNSNIRYLPAFPAYLYMCCPADAWGSRGAYESWPGLQNLREGNLTEKQKQKWPHWVRE